MLKRVIARTGKRRIVNICNTEEIINPAFCGTETSVEDPRLQRRRRYIGVAPKISLLESKTTVVDADKKIGRDRFVKTYGVSTTTILTNPTIMLELRTGLDNDEPLPFEWGQQSSPKLTKNKLLHFDYCSYGEK